MSGSEAFDDIVAALNYPMFVVTTKADDGAVAGCLVGFASQTSIRPPRFLVGLSRKNRTFRVAQQSTHLAVHVLSREHLETAELFGSETGDEVDKFARCDWEAGPSGLPILTDASAWFVGRIVDRFDVGDHVGHLLEPTDGDASEMSRDWVLFADVRDLNPGHEA
ncbi:flavin reductase family protein [Mycobacterium sp. 1274761.0]|uniref:flavin reductase family protein n=1 Tax=Mycobacterium sp. 1274761.0 TaxID=1834077 RepID=UPI0007FE04F9|nr:flavin reductase family protein [Mycobacterium sp. 1274761.0]OBK79294.1 flavin reductase [Mycobacterium sp. 1274761.0]